VNTPLVSIIIANWNGQAYLRPCFKALQAQTYPHLEVILVDNASHDESLTLTRQEYPWVKVLALPQNLGFTGASNAGLRAAQGDILILLNNDTEAEAHWVQHLVESLHRHPSAGMAASKMRLFNQPDRLHSAGDSFGSNGIPQNRGVWQKDEGQFDTARFIFGGCGGAVAYRRAMLNKIGLLDDDFFFSYEDVDLNWRAQLAGYACVFVPQAIVYHHLSATGGGATASYYVGRNSLWVLAQSVPGAVWRRYGGRIVLAQLKITLEALRAWRGEAARARLRGQVAGLLGLPKILRKRRHIQARQTVPDWYLLGLLD
jgi:GT2 family glycosyltransferase